MSTITTEQTGRVVTATLANPPHALMTSPMIKQLHEHVRTWEDDDSVGAVVLTGDHPDRFLAHFDVAAILEGAKAAPTVPPAAIRATLSAAAGAKKFAATEKALGRTPLAGALEILEMHETLLDIERSGVVYIAALNGSAMGGGCELSLACDFRIMVDADIVIGQPELFLGFPPGGGGTQRLVRLLGAAKARELVLDFQPLSPAEALDIGLVTRVAEPDALLDAARAMAARLASRSKPGVRAAKRAISVGGSLPIEAGLQVEAAEFFASVTSDEAIRLMEFYVKSFEELGEVPLYHPDWAEAFLAGESFATYA